MSDAEPLIDAAFAGEVIYWRGPAPFFYLPLPAELAADVKRIAKAATYGWGVIPVEATLAGGAPFTTSLFPRDGGYLLPLKDAVRHPAKVTAGDTVSATLLIYPRR